jgi:hypothetical protein
MQRNFSIILILLIFYSCGNQRTEVKPKTEKRSDTIALITSYRRNGCDTCSYAPRNNAQVCDTCWSTLIVKHEECTECKDLLVDSGTVYVDRTTINYFDSLFRTRKSSPDEIPVHTNLINTMDLYLENPKDFRKLWKFPDVSDCYKRYRVTGKVTGPKYTYSLQFQIKRFTLLDTVYSKKFDR